MSRTPLLNTQTLSLFSRRLLNYPTYRLKYQPNAKNAAVLLPICHNEHNQPSILFTVRNLEMRTHKGEVSFPGGKQDPADGSVEETALRETMEEIGIAPKDIDILGQFSCIPNQSGSLRVHPFVGYVRKPVNASLLNCNPEEVARAFCLPLEYLLDPSVRVLRKILPEHYT
ncbi:NUDIX hydrolase domain-like protein [Phycomyces nitens]|nr:NUDIX hydrolase domain-like protein [Phycomyces nitens]